MKRAVVLSLLLLLTFVASLFAQTTNAIVTGTVQDAASAVVPKVQVTLENVRTGIVQTSASNEAGVYLFPTVQPGSYRLTASAPGFQKYIVNDITVDVGAHLNINVPLALASANESVEVTATADSAFFIDSPSVGGVISGRK